jgi:tetratricopeptide (TPR) repeat protein
MALMVMALVYALVAGLHTVFDLDMGWHLATGRWVVQHHAIPSMDVLSYTSPGAEWLYPPFAGVLLYRIFSVWGYAGLTWFCMLVLVATVALVLRHSSRRESGLIAGFTILAVPILAERANPRADLFTPLFFAIFLVQLWAFHGSDPAAQSNQATMRRVRLRLWILPPSMLLWVNLHPGFIAGLGLILAYLLMEGLDLPIAERRRAAFGRLRLAWPALAATVLATLLNPYGPRIFKASLHLAGLGTANAQSSPIAVEELTPVPLGSITLAQFLDWRSPDHFLWLAFAVLVAIVLAFWRRQLGAAVLMAAALYGAMQHRRYKGLFAIVAIVVGASILTEALQNRRQVSGKAAARPFGLWEMLGGAAVGALLLVTCVHIADYVSSRRYIAESAPMRFGVGESWWFPERAADFVRREDLPGNIFQIYSLGGFTAWRLGSAYPDFIDGRNLDPGVLNEEQQLLGSSPDSAVWQAEADRRNINLLFFSLARFSGVGSPDLMSLCKSKQWKPVYMDEVSMVMLRNRRENRAWIDRYGLDCLTHNFLPTASASRLDLANFYANAGDILLHLGRLSEAQQALEQATALSPGDPSVHLALGQLHEEQHQFDEAEREYKTSLSTGGEPEIVWLCLGRLYSSQGGYVEARTAILTAAQLSAIPASEYNMLGGIDLRLGQPEQALSDYAKAEAVGEQYWRNHEDQHAALFAQIAEGRASAYAQMGEWQSAIESEQAAIQRTPENAARWKTLGDLYQRAGEAQFAEQAYQRASALSK